MAFLFYGEEGDAQMACFLVSVTVVVEVRAAEKAANHYIKEKLKEA